MFIVARGGGVSGGGAGGSRQKGVWTAVLAFSLLPPPSPNYHL